jgi:hypothetical protein
MLHWEIFEHQEKKWQGVKASSLYSLITLPFQVLANTTSPDHWDVIAEVSSS